MWRESDALSSLRADVLGRDYRMRGRKYGQTLSFRKEAKLLQYFSRDSVHQCGKPTLHDLFFFGILITLSILLFQTNDISVKLLTINK